MRSKRRGCVGFDDDNEPNINKILDLALEDNFMFLNENQDLAS
jgi:hypothetical protein